MRIYWEKIKIDGKEVFNIVNPDINIETDKNQNVFGDLSKEELDRFKESIPKKCLGLPLYVNKIKCII